MRYDSEKLGVKIDPDTGEVIDNIDVRIKQLRIEKKKRDYVSYKKKEHLKDLLVNMSKAMVAKDLYTTHKYMEYIMEEIKNPQTPYSESELSYAKSRIMDVLVKIYKNEVIAAYESLKEHEYNLPAYPTNYTEDPYKNDLKKKLSANAKTILMQRYARHQMGGYMHKVISRIIEEYENPDPGPKKKPMFKVQEEKSTPKNIEDSKEAVGNSTLFER